MIRAISGIRVGTVQLRPYVSKPENRLQFLQHKDVFFSNQSLKATVERFLKQSPGQAAPKPMVVYFGQASEPFAFLNTVFPAEKTAVVATPIRVS